MAWNDPLRRYELAQRLQRLKQAGASESDGPASAVIQPPLPDPLTDDRLRDLVSRVVAEMASTEGAPVPETPEPAAPAWQDEWWSPDTGPTERASQAFRGRDGWVLAWVLHLRTGLPLAAVEEREPGSRLRFWIRRHVVVDILDGRYLDIDGLSDRASVTARHTSPRASSRRVRSLPDPPRWEHLEVPGAAGAPWQDLLVDTRPEVVERVAAELAARHGLGGRT
ncbi:MAG: hypothetical protein ACFCVF_02405 [Kineosporiaceae bacterium]